MKLRQLVRLKPLDSSELILTVAGWLAQKENYQWLQFGDGRQILTPVLLKIMSQRDAHVLRVYVSEDGAPLGIVGLDEVNRNFKTARLWVVAGEKNCCGRGYATEAAQRLMDWARAEHGVRRFISSTTPDNAPSLRVHEKLGFRRTGQVVDGEIIFELHA